MPYKRFVETGRVAVVGDGPKKGKLVSIVDCIDQTRVLVDGPYTGVPRSQMRINQLHLTKFRIKFPFTAPTKVVRKAWTDSKIEEKWANSLWAKKAEAKKKRAILTDFDRFKLRNARSRRNKIRTLAFFTLRKTASRNGSLYGKKKMAKGGDKPYVKKGGATAAAAPVTKELVKAVKEKKPAKAAPKK